MLDVPRMACVRLDVVKKELPADCIGIAKAEAQLQRASA